MLHCIELPSYIAANCQKMITGVVRCRRAASACRCRRQRLEEVGTKDSHAAPQIQRRGQPNTKQQVAAAGSEQVGATIPWEGGQQYVGVTIPGNDGRQEQKIAAVGSSRQRQHGAWMRGRRGQQEGDRTLVVWIPGTIRIPGMRGIRRKRVPNARTGLRLIVR